MPTESTFSDQDEAAFQYCLKALKSDPQVTYKEVRREARNAESVSVKRHVWTAARKKLGLIPEESAAPGPAPRRPDNPDAGTDDRPEPPGGDPRERDRPYRPRSDRGRPGGRDRDGGPYRGPRRGPDGPDRMDDRQRPDRRMDRPAPPSRPDHRRPAWATPPENRSQRPSAPPPPSAPPGNPAAPPAPPAGSTPFDDVLDPVTGKPVFVSPRRNSVDFCVEYLEKLPEATFQEVKVAGEREGFAIYPATFGRAQAQVGIVEADATVLKKPPAPVAPAAPPPTRPAAPPPPPPRAKKTSDIDPVEGFQAFIDALMTVEHDRVVLRRAIEAMLEVVQNALK